MREKELKKRAERGENDVKGKEKRFEHWQIIAAYLVIYDIFAVNFSYFLGLLLRVVGVATQAALFEKTISNMVEVKSRGAYLMGLTTYGNYNIEDTADFAVYVPQTESFFATSLAIVPLQLMGYYVSVAKGLDVDKPRNLAKSVTVE